MFFLKTIPRPPTRRQAWGGISFASYYRAATPVGICADQGLNRYWKQYLSSVLRRLSTEPCCLSLFKAKSTEPLDASTFRHISLEVDHSFVLPWRISSTSACPIIKTIEKQHYKSFTRTCSFRKSFSTNPSLYYVAQCVNWRTYWKRSSW